MNERYVDGHLEEALARAGETDVHVHVTSEGVVLTGTVTTEQRRTAVTGIAAAHAGDLAVFNQLTVLHCVEPDGEEVLP